MSEVDKASGAGRETGRETGRDGVRVNDPERTMAEILAVATQEFADKGLAGARIDEIAATTRTSKRMIYYYFGSKDGLYLAVLEEAYGRMRHIEAQLHLDDLQPVQALRSLVEFTYDHHQSNEPFIRLVMSENIHRAQYLKQSQTIRQLNVKAIDAIEQLYQRGLALGLFRLGLLAVDIHAAISALTVFNVANRHTFGTIFERGTEAGPAQTLQREQVVQMVLRYVSHSNL